MNALVDDDVAFCEKSAVELERVADRNDFLKNDLLAAEARADAGVLSEVRRRPARRLLGWVTWWKRTGR
jgi:hypothetical protein